MATTDWQTAAATLRLAGQLVDGIQDGLAARGFTDIRPAHGYVFAALSTGMTTSGLAVALDITEQAAAQLVDTLVERGYLRRQPRPSRWPSPAARLDRTRSRVHPGGRTSRQRRRERLAPSGLQSRFLAVHTRPPRHRQTGTASTVVVTTGDDIVATAGFKSTATVSGSPASSRTSHKPRASVPEHQGVRVIAA